MGNAAPSKPAATVDHAKIHSLAFSGLRNVLKNFKYNDTMGLRIIALMVILRGLWLY
jgi:hypothetical protein